MGKEVVKMFRVLRPSRVWGMIPLFLLIDLAAGQRE